MKLVAVAITVGLLFAPRIARACAPAPRLGEEVAIADEEAIIVWDPTTKTEQFIRRARFDTTGSSFGFLVPTPTRPTLDEVPVSVFAQLAAAIRPRVEVVSSGISIVPTALLFEACGLRGVLKSAPPPDDATAGVTVIQSVAVAGFQATTIEASDPAAISAWLGEHGFASTPQLTEWLARYVEDKWVITAFVIGDATQSDDAPRSLATSAVRMTFHTERPFYPYREPAKVPMTTTPRVTTAARMLRVFFLPHSASPPGTDKNAVGQYRATLGIDRAWGARVVHASTIAAPAELGIGRDVYASVFVDESHPRVATDELYFKPSNLQDDITQVKTIEKPRRIPIPIDVLVVAALVVGFAWRRRRLRTSTS